MVCHALYNFDIKLDKIVLFYFMCVLDISFLNNGNLFIFTLIITTKRLPHKIDVCTLQNMFYLVNIQEMYDI